MLIREEIPEEERILPEWSVKLREEISGLYIPGHFTEEEATQIIAQTIGMDWALDKKEKPACSRILVQVLEKVCNQNI